MSDITKHMLERRAETEQKLVIRAWNDEEFRKQLLANPESVIAQELGLGELPGGIKVQVLEENSNTLYFVLPKKPANIEGLNIQEELTETALEAVVGGGVIPLYGSTSLFSERMSPSILFVLRTPGL